MHAASVDRRYEVAILSCLAATGACTSERRRRYTVHVSSPQANPPRFPKCRTRKFPSMHLILRTTSNRLLMFRGISCKILNLPSKHASTLRRPLEWSISMIFTGVRVDLFVYAFNKKNCLKNKKQMKVELGNIE